MIKIGMLLGDRYEILEKVGTGGMADVYKSKDHTLNRFVAVKVLKQEFSENANFVSKFRVEAQAAAGLAHPNIVNVYDVGEEKGIYYIVMELVDGITLKSYIEKKGGLPYKEAVSIAIQVSMGLETAHRGHIIHRDIKPQNIIISRDGKVKVTDFGIAKAATSDTITSNVMGSVHYTSPEQARGGYSDEKSDIYSLGVTLFEMVTGQVPFDGETTVAIAIRHIQDPMPSPRELKPDLPYAVEQIIMKCCEKSPDRRYSSMSELAADLKRSMSDPDGDFVKRYDAQELGKTHVMTQAEKKKILDSVRKSKNEEVDSALAEQNADYSGGEASGTAYAVRGEEEQDEDDYYGKNPGDEKRRRRRKYERDDEDLEDEIDDRMERTARILTILAVVIITAIVVTIVSVRLGLFGGGSGASQQSVQETVETVSMPVVIGQDIDAARASVVRAGLIPEITYEESDRYAAGIVMKTSVPEGEQVPVGSTVLLTVCGNSGTEVPDVTGKDREEAETLLTEAGFLINVTLVYSEDKVEGTVISQDPAAGVSAAAGSYITLTVSQGPDLSDKAKVPKLIGMTEQEARSLISELGLHVGTVRVNKDADPNDRGLVISQGIEANQYVKKGTYIDFEVGGQQTYSYNSDISAPGYAEDPDYKTGTPVHLQIVSADGRTLLDTTTSDFPYRTGFTGLTSSTGTLTMTYENTVIRTIEVPVEPDPVPETPPEGETGEGAETPAPAPQTPRTETMTMETTEEKVLTRELTFTPEN